MSPPRRALRATALVNVIRFITMLVVTTDASRTAGTPQAIVLIIANVLPTMGIVSLIPVIPQLFAHFHDEPHSLFLVPSIITAPSVCIALLSPVVGVIADRIGRRALLLLALLVYAFVGCAPLVLDGLRAIIASRVCLGVTEAIILTTVNALMGDYFKGEARRKWLSYQNAAGSLMASGLIVAGGVLATISWRAPFGLYALALPMIGAVLAYTWEPSPQEEPPPSAAETAVKFPWMAMSLVYSVTLLSAMIFFVEPLQLGLVMNAGGFSSPALIGVVSAATGFALPVGAYLIGRMKRLYVGPSLAVAYALFSCGFACLGLSRGLPGIVVGACLAQFACGLTYPLTTIWAHSKLQFAVRARGMGMWISCFFIGQFLSTMSVSGLTQLSGGIGAAVCWYAALCALAAAVTWAFAKLCGRGTPLEAHSEASAV
jgi:MFS family permease